MAIVSPVNTPSFFDCHGFTTTWIQNTETCFDPQMQRKHRLSHIHYTRSQCQEDWLLMLSDIQNLSTGLSNCNYCTSFTSVCVQRRAVQKYYNHRNRHKNSNTMINWIFWDQCFITSTRELTMNSGKFATRKRQGKTLGKSDKQAFMCPTLDR